MLKLEEGEKIIHEVRRHWFVILATAAGVFVAALIPVIFLMFLLVAAVIPVASIAQGSTLVIFFYSLWLLMLWVFLFLDWTDYFLDVWYITDRRIVDVEQKGLFSREVISLPFETIQDITVETHGFVQTMLKFGDLHVQTAGASRKIVLKNARLPEEAKEIVLASLRKVKSAPQAVTVVDAA